MLLDLTFGKQQHQDRQVKTEEKSSHTSSASLEQVQVQQKQLRIIAVVSYPTYIERTLTVTLPQTDRLARATSTTRSELHLLLGQSYIYYSHRNGNTDKGPPHELPLHLNCFQIPFHLPCKAFTSTWTLTDVLLRGFCVMFLFRKKSVLG